jgi:hypothetical protein
MACTGEFNMTDDEIKKKAREKVLEFRPDAVQFAILLFDEFSMGQSPWLTIWIMNKNVATSCTSIELAG